MSQRQDTRLETEPIGKLMFSLAVPAVIAQLINVLYNIIDRIYIGHMPEVGDVALTGVGITFPILMIISAFSAFIGMGGAPLASIELGSKNYKKAEQILGNSVVVLVSISIVLTILFSIFKTPILYAFGASDDTIVYAIQYLSIYLLGTIFVQIALGLNTFISAQGFAKIAMTSVLIGAFLNIILDPLFIFVFQMGVKGAALATILSQCVSSVWVLKFLLSSKSVIKIRKENMHFDKQIIFKIGALGISPFIMQSTESLVTIVLNSGLQHYGNDMYVGSMTIIMSVMQVVSMPMQGITQGVQPIMSYNYGAGKNERVEKTFKRLLLVCLTFACFACFITRVFPQFFVYLFNDKPELVEVTVKVMPIFFAGIWAYGAQCACQSTFLAMGQAKISLFLALLRKVVLLVPLALILPVYYGVYGIYYAEPIADVISGIVTFLIFQLTYKKILLKNK